MASTALGTGTGQGQWREALENASKATGLGILIIYGIGFLTISIHNSTFGFAEVNPLRPHIFAAGALFLLLTIPQALSAIKLYSHELELSPEARFSRALVASLSVLVGSWFLSLICQFMVQAPRVSESQPPP